MRIIVQIDPLDRGYVVTCYADRDDDLGDTIHHACEDRASVGKSVTGMLLEIEEMASIEAEARVRG